MRRRYIRKLHIIVGIGVLIPLLFYTITAFILHHKDSWQWLQKPIINNYILSWYGYSPLSISHYYPLDNKPSLAVVQSGNITCLINCQNKTAVTQLTAIQQKIIGGISNVRGVFIATANQLYFYDHKGVLIETLNATSTSLPAGKIKRIGYIKNGQIVLQVAVKYYLFDRDLINYRLFNSTTQSVQWQQTASIEDQTLKLLEPYHKPNNITLSRLVSDLHSGRLFPYVQTLCIYSFTFGVLILCFSGVRLLFRFSPRRR